MATANKKDSAFFFKIIPPSPQKALFFSVHTNTNSIHCFIVYCGYYYNIINYGYLVK